jgi:uncharacterized phage protein gp47/JayE
MANLSLIVDDTGISAPTYEAVLASLQDSYRSIYGADVYLEPDSQDGQFLAILALSIKNANDAGIAVYNSFRPGFAQGAGLSSVVKINGLKRLIPSNSSAVVTLVGQAGTIITSGLVSDNLNLNTTWALPDSVTIPVSGTVDVLAISTTAGAVRADVGTLTKIMTPTPGWQTVTNISAATAGNPAESDADLRRRQTVSTALPANSVVRSTYGAVLNVPGVTRATIYENVDAIVDANGLPGHSISVVAEGGDVSAIASVIELRKTPGSSTYGTTTVEVIDSAGLRTPIHFFPLIVVPLTIVITLTALQGYTSLIGTRIVQQVIDWVNSLPIGYDSYLSKLEAATELAGADGLTYTVTAVTQARSGTPSASDIVIAFNEAAHTSTDIITLVVV